MKREIITSTDPKSPVSEVFRTLRTNLQYLNKKNGAQTILLTSTLQGEGKSFVAANLAVTFAQARKKTIIVDTDMRKPRQHKLFDSDMYPGLSNYLAGININRDNHNVSINECIYQTKVENLSILPAGNIPPNPSELLQLERLGQLVRILKNEYDVVIFDGAPCLLVTDATLVSRLVDATVLVASHKHTKLDDLKEARNRIRRVGGRIAGVVLNRIKLSGRRYGEKYYYYYATDSLKDKTKRRMEAESDSDQDLMPANRGFSYRAFLSKFFGNNYEIDEYEPETDFWNSDNSSKNNAENDNKNENENNKESNDKSKVNYNDSKNTKNTNKAINKPKFNTSETNNNKLKKNKKELIDSIKETKKRREINDKAEDNKSRDDFSIKIDENDEIKEIEVIEDKNEKDSRPLDTEKKTKEKYIKREKPNKEKHITKAKVEAENKEFIDEELQGSAKIKKILADIQKMKEDIK